MLFWVVEENPWKTRRICHWTKKLQIVHDRVCKNAGKTHSVPTYKARTKMSIVNFFFKFASPSNAWAQ